MGKNRSGVDELNAMLQGGGGASLEGAPEQKQLTEEEVTKKAEKIMAVVVVEGESDLFLMQELLEQCSALVRIDIQEEFYADPDDEGGA